MRPKQCLIDESLSEDISVGALSKIMLALLPPSDVRIYVQDSPGQNTLGIKLSDVNMKKRSSSTVINK